MYKIEKSLIVRFAFFRVCFELPNNELGISDSVLLKWRANLVHLDNYVTFITTLVLHFTNNNINVAIGSCANNNGDTLNQLTWRSSSHHSVLKSKYTQLSNCLQMPFLGLWWTKFNYKIGCNLNLQLYPIFFYCM